MNEAASRDSQEASGFGDASLYRELSGDPPEHRPSALPQVTFEHVLQADIPSEGQGYLAGILTQVSAEGDNLQLSYAEAPTAHHNQLAKKFWGNELAAGLQQVKAGEHEFDIVSRYSLDPEQVFLQIVTDGDWDSQAARSVVRQTIVGIGSYLLTHPDNHARQSTPHVTVSLSEGDYGNKRETYNLRQLELLKDAPLGRAT